MSAIFPTGGPWQVKSEYEPSIVIGNVDGEYIDGVAHCTYDFVCKTLDDDDDSQSRSVAFANARLIAEAPSLLRELGLARDFIDAERACLFECSTVAGHADTLDEDAKPAIERMDEQLRRIGRTIARATGAT